MLAARGLGAVAGGGRSAGGFLDPRLTDLHDPSLLPGVEAAAERLLAALAGGERIAIYGDYDVDGVTATAILFHTLRALRPGCDVIAYVPHRLEE
ncbi:MAG TPA: hypothetical protein VD963_05975, partial [Phycisphaerales bacterium]|nr:hypothetical protein [Phycisphaerales bacterium]